ncbi:MAG TPA: hypothetical protein VD908_07825 [Cytophagales bacterium]|nr:hypothetical protein [Cytophagales bacterium]
MRKITFEDRQLLEALKNTEIEPEKKNILSVLSGVLQAKDLDIYIEDLEDAQYYLVQLNADAKSPYPSEYIGDMCHTFHYLLTAMKQIQKINIQSKIKAA